MSSAGSGLTPQQLNMAQRAAVLASAVEMIQPLAPVAIATPGNNNNVVNITPRAVGLTKKFIVEITGTVNNTDGSANSTATQFGLANLLTQVLFTDLNNNQRINTSGVHLAILKQVKHKTTDPGSAPVSTKLDDAILAGEFVASGTAPNYPVVVYPLPGHGASAAFRAVFEVPLAYSDQDLRGAVYLNVINAQTQLTLTLNPNPCNTGADATSGVWAGGAGNISGVTIQVYQVYLDQLPVGQQGVILPVLDLSTIYALNLTAFNNPVANQDFPISYANFRDFLSTLAIFNSTGATAGLKNGSDVAYWALQSANFTNLFKIDPLLSAQFTREIIGSDLPLGTYYFSHRKKPISTTQYGNMQLVLNASAVSGVPYVLVGWEAFALVNTLSQAGSLAS